jgi:polysaccharide biosynthesis/export protein
MLRTILLHIALAAALVASLTFAAQQDPPATPGPSAASAGDNTASAAGDTSQTGAPLLQRRNPRYKIERGDSINLDFPFTPEYNETVAVQPDGYIDLITIGDMHVEGMTTPELTTALRQAYAKVLHEPIITVTMNSFENPYFIVGGEVGKPGKYILHGDTTVSQAVEIAGGLTYASKHSHILLFRRVSDDWISARVINLKKQFSAGNLSEDLHIEPGDFVFIPKNRLAKLQPYIPFLLPENIFHLDFQAYNQ